VLSVLFALSFNFKHLYLAKEVS